MSHDGSSRNFFIAGKTVGYFLSKCGEIRPHTGIIIFFLQVLRSADRWSTGTCESSILNAYIHTIENSQHYIYIEVMQEWLI